MIEAGSSRECSHIELAPLLYKVSTIWSRVGGHAVCLRCLTWEIWRPRLRWTLQHSSHMKVPLFTDAQEGSGPLQSAHTSLLRSRFDMVPASPAGNPASDGRGGGGCASALTGPRAALAAPLPPARLPAPLSPGTLRTRGGDGLRSPAGHVTGKGTLPYRHLE